MKRAITATAIVLIVVAPSLVSAKVDTSCSGGSATSAITGTVKNAKGQPLQGMTVQLSLTNDPGTTPENAQTNVTGFYRICAGGSSGAGHNTYDVHARDTTATPLYAAVNQPYTTYSNVAGDANFTPESGLPMRYMTNLRISPAEISTDTTGRWVTWIVRSKAPAIGTSMRLTLGHRNDTTVTMSFDGVEQGGPSAGGWNRWTHTEWFARDADEALFWASVRGFEGSVQTTQVDRQPYVIDNKPPILGPASAAVTGCGPGVTAGAFSPASPPGTTNPMPIVLHGVCDHWSNGARSGLNPFSLTGLMCRDPNLTVSCQTINPVLNTYTIVWYPSAPLSLGDYYFQWSIADYAGNSTTNSTGYKLTVTDKGGQKPRFSGVTPGNLGSGTSLGIVFGSAATSPSSYPAVGFRVTDADGNRDLVPGTLTVRVYYLGENEVAGVQAGLVYSYDPFSAPNFYDPVGKRGGGTFNLDGGWFQASGYPLQGKPPGRYLATASVTDHGGNTATVTWHWLLAAAL